MVLTFKSIFTLTIAICLIAINVIHLEAAYLCEEPGSFADPEDCSKYHVCAYNEAGDLMDNEMTCADSTVCCQRSHSSEDPMTCPCGSTGPSDPDTTTESSVNEWPKSCSEIQLMSDPENLNSTNPYKIYPFGPKGSGIRVRCDFETEGGGWTLISNRGAGPSDEFYKNWVEYENGFGSAEDNYWIGLKAIFALTSGSPQALRVDLGDWEGMTAQASYSQFSIADETDFYRISVSGYTGDAGDSFNYDGNGMNNNMQFSTHDNDHDNDAGNCANYYKGGWWFNYCFYSHLNGAFYDEGHHNTYQGIQWMTWREEYSLKTASMKIRDSFSRVF